MTLTYRGHGVFDESYGIFLLFLLTTTMGFLALGYIFGSFRAIWSELVGVVFLLLITYLSFFAKYTATINIDTRRDEILFTQKELLRKKESSCTISEIAHVELRKGSVGKYPTSRPQLFLVRKNGTDALTLSPPLAITTFNTKKLTPIGTQIANFLSLPLTETVAGY